VPVSSWSASRRAVVAAVAVVLVLVLVAATVVVLRLQRERRLDAAAEAAARSFAAAAETRDLATARLSTDAAAAQAAYATAVAGLGDIAPDVEVLEVRRDGDTGEADLRWTWPLGDGWSYESTLPVTGDGEGWAAVPDLGAVHPSLTDGAVLEAVRTASPRAPVLGRDGAPVFAERPVVDVGVQPSRVTDAAGLSRTLAGLLDVDAAALEQRIAAAAPEAFVPVITLRRSDYEPLRGQLQPLPGTVFREGERPLAPTREFARALLGTVGEATAELVEQSEGRLQPGDLAGLSGLQRAYDERLAGSAGVVVNALRDGEVSEQLFAAAPEEGQFVRVTLDAAVQQAADAALATATGGNGNAALVAVDVPTGDVLAVANTPASGSNRALTGQYPPGSTFKAVTAYALLGTGLQPEEPVGCPPTATVDGRPFRNFEGGALGQVPFREAFASSCNTAFVGLSDRLGPGSLTEAGGAFGLGAPWQVGVDVFGGEVPETSSPVDQAAAAIGQGRLLASPAALAQVAATVARGSWQPARLVVEPPPDAVPDPVDADPARLAAVRELMRQVVASGTASALADVPGEPVHAKTGTAEYGAETPPRTHAWVIGFRGPLAFAVLVEDGASGGAVAVPVAEAFLRGL
jgi:cell division protein FtsI/penicillin-binding protein 2